MGLIVKPRLCHNLYTAMKVCVRQFASVPFRRFLGDVQRASVKVEGAIRNNYTR
jgi:hypothetical protein